MKKEKLEVQLEIQSNYKDSNRSYTRGDLERELEWFTTENHLKIWDINNVVIEKSLYQKLKDVGFNNMYDLVENLNVALELIGENEEEMEDLRSGMWIVLRSIHALPMDYKEELVFTEDAIRRVKTRYRTNFFEYED